MTKLSPSQASVIAQDVYAIRELDLDKAMKMSAHGLGLGDEFKADKSARFLGESGLLMTKRPLDSATLPKERAAAPEKF